MGSINSYPSRELARLRRDWIRHNAGLVGSMLVFYVAVVGISTWFHLALGVGWHAYILGAIHVGLAATLLHLINSAVLAHERTAVFQLRGAWGEDATRSELSRAKLRRLVWGWVDSISLQVGDLDHVVVTRSGGVVVLDSKFRTEVTGAGISDMAATAKRAKIRTEALTRQLLTADRSGRHRATGHPVTVTAGIVLWGPARRDVPPGHVIDGVHFVDGRKLLPWLKRLSPSEVSKAAGADLLERLTQYRDSARGVR